ncbi:MAG: efflux RND transporter periplasmic adaptor subunit [Phycisphaerae bacterium]|nr:efflux RND transporter periplasmic adaptor subunit [Phycisphaerae bacterium]
MKLKHIPLLIVILAAVLAAIVFVKNKAKVNDPHAGHDHPTPTQKTDEDADHDEGPGHIEGDMVQDHDDDEALDGHAEGQEDPDHAGPAVPDPHAGHDDEQVIVLTDQQIKDYGIKLETAQKGSIETIVNLPGEVAVNSDRMVHIVPRVTGVVLEVMKKLGDPVKAGEVMAVIQSRELADAKGAYLAAIERLELSKSIFEREEKLREKKISSEQEYLGAKKVFAEARIEKRSAEQKLRALGFSEAYLVSLPSESEKLLTRFEITAPFAGAILEKHITLGEVVSNETSVFIVADLSTVWIDLHVYQKYLMSVRKGQKALISAGNSISDVHGTISYVGPFVAAKSRTALARIVMDNKDGTLRPGIFVTAKVATETTAAAVVVAKDAIQTIEAKKCVFIKDEDGFETRFVTTGKSDAEKVEIISGLEQGEKYVSKGAFELKAKIVTSTLGSHAGHGH